MMRWSLAMMLVGGLALAGCRGGQEHAPLHAKKTTFEYAQLICSSDTIGLRQPGKEPVDAKGWDDISKKFGCKTKDQADFEIMNRLGSEGWKLISADAISILPGTVGFVYTFERPVN